MYSKSSNESQEQLPSLTINLGNLSPSSCLPSPIASHQRTNSPTLVSVGSIVSVGSLTGTRRKADTGTEELQAASEKESQFLRCAHEVRDFISKTGAEPVLTSSNAKERRAARWLYGVRIDKDVLTNGKSTRCMQRLLRARGWNQGSDRSLRACP